jgi:RNA polymerase sigma factor (sigma-70 family)
MELTEHLFRRESGRMVAALARVFGVRNLGLAEDAVQDAFCRAVEQWKFRGVPENPSAWLMAAARNRVIDILRRRRTAETLGPDFAHFSDMEQSVPPVIDELFGPDAIRDDLLRMMFSCCQPRLAEEAQVALILHILCGFGISEIAAAFVSGEAAIEKRITRAKKTLADSKRLFDLAAAREFAARLPAVQRALYLLFNEGYHSASTEIAVRVELCREAMRLTALLLEHPLGKTPASHALAALMALHAARLPGRVNPAGDLMSLLAQDRARWDRELIAEGFKLLELSATGPDLTEYHIEAAIASLHASAASERETDWKRIVELYDALIRLRPSPIIALNRAIAIAQAEGPRRGLAELEAVADSGRLARYPFYAAAQGELELRLGRHDRARAHFRRALAIARNPMERRFLDRRIQVCEADASSTA